LVIIKDRHLDKLEKVGGATLNGTFQEKKIMVNLVLGCNGSDEKSI
jgi:hypothetical protein